MVSLSLVSTTRNFFLKYAPRKRDPFSGTPAPHTIITDSDKVLEQLSLSLSPLPHNVTKNRSQRLQDHSTESLGNVASGSSEELAVSKRVLSRNMYLDCLFRLL